MLFQGGHGNEEKKPTGRKEIGKEKKNQGFRTN